MLASTDFCWTAQCLSHCSLLFCTPSACSDVFGVDCVWFVARSNSRIQVSSNQHVCVFVFLGVFFWNSKYTCCVCSSPYPVCWEEVTFSLSSFNTWMSSWILSSLVSERRVSLEHHDCDRVVVFAAASLCVFGGLPSFAPGLSLFVAVVMWSCSAHLHAPSSCFTLLSWQSFAFGTCAGADVPSPWDVT